MDPCNAFKSHHERDHRCARPSCIARSREGWIMTDISRLLLALIAGTLVVSFAGDGQAKSRRERPRPAPAVEQAQTPPAPLPRQFFPEKGVQPLTPELEQTLKPKDSFKECDTCPEMVVVSAGSFTMGTPADEPYRLKGEDPQHRVTIAKPFAVGRFAISFDEWDAYVADGGCGGYKGSDYEYGRRRMPANSINLDQAKSY